MESQRSESLKMEGKSAGGRPPHLKVKLILKRIMKELGAADVNLVKNRYVETTGQSANYHTIKKYLDQLVDQDYLRVQVAQDNIRQIERGESRVRRRVFLYQVNENFHTHDKMVD